MDHDLPPAGALSVLVLLTRDPGGRATGRLAVLRSHLAALRDLGHTVTAVVVSADPPTAGTWKGVALEHVRAPGLLPAGLRGLRAVATGRGSANEALFVNRRVVSDVARVAARVRPDVVVADTLRLWGAAEHLGVPVVVDLDDLLSRRYAQMAQDGGRSRSVLGFVGERLPAPLRRPAGSAVLRVLGREARLVGAREQEVCRSAAAVTLVSATEAEQLTRASGRQVQWLPPSVPVPERPVGLGEGLVLLGGLDYGPNAEALRFYRDQVLPHLVHRPGGPPVLHVVGHCPQPLRAEFAVPGIALEGFAPDLALALTRRLLVAPVISGGGIKVKVLDALAHGLPVVATPLALEGIPVPAEASFTAADGAGLARQVERLLDDDALALAAAAAGRRLAEREFSPAAAVARWQRLLAAVTAPLGAPRGRPGRVRA